MGVRGLIAAAFTALLILGCMGGGGQSKGELPPRRAKPKNAKPSDEVLEGGFKLYTVKDAEDRKAVCNNGGRATYFVSRGKGAQADNWVLFLKGGGACNSVEECREREKTKDPFMKPYGKHRGPNTEGILGNNRESNPDFWDWSKLYLPYCSSDFWLGDRGASEETDGLHFRGLRILNAILDDVAAGEHGKPTLASARRVMLLGGSAGAVGMQNNLDRVAKRFGNVQVVGVSDSFVAPGEPTVKIPTPEAVKKSKKRSPKAAFWNASFDTDCTKRFGNYDALCLNASVLNPFIQTPMFLYMDQYDAHMLNTRGLAKSSPESHKLAAGIRQTLDDYDGGCFSTQAGIHVLVTKENFTGLKVKAQDGKRYSYSDVLANWYHDRDGPKKVVAMRKQK